MNRKALAGNKLYIALFIVTIVAITLMAVFGENGLVDVYGFRAERDGLLARNMAIEVENEKLAEEIRLLKTDRRYIAAVARKELGMIGKNEIIYKTEEK
ncbi:MAG: septum formation initiator family protein [Thermodesulfobacteriota bacterium]